MEPVTIFMVVVTVGTLSKNLADLLMDGDAIKKYFKELEHDLETLRLTINHVENLLYQDDIKHALNHPSANNIIAVINQDFENCHKLIESFMALMNERQDSKRDMFMRRVLPSRRKAEGSTLRDKITDQILRVQTGLQILNLQATCGISRSVKELWPQVSGDLEPQISELRELLQRLTGLNRDSLEESGAVVQASSVRTLEDAASLTLNQALVVWREQGSRSNKKKGKERADSVHQPGFAFSRAHRAQDPGNSYAETVYSEAGPSNDRGHQHRANTSRPQQPPAPLNGAGLNRKPLPTADSRNMNLVHRGSTRSNRKVIAICGMTGSGKTSFISKLVGKDVGIGHGLHSETSEIQEVSYKFGNQDVTLVDTPGFADTSMSDTEVLQKIAFWLEDTCRDGTLLSGIVYLHPINHTRVDGPSNQNIKLLRKLCGDKSMRNVILATTMWETESPSDTQVAREKELKDDFWSEMMGLGSQVYRYTNTPASATKIIAEMMRNDPTKLNIQHEMVDEDKQLIDTEAGACVNADLEKLQAKHQMELDDIREELGGVIQTNSEEARREHARLENNYKKMLVKIAKDKQDMEALHGRQIYQLRNQLEESDMRQANQAHAHRQAMLDQKKEMDRQAKLNQQARNDQKKEMDKRTKQFQQEIQKEVEKQARVGQQLLQEQKIEAKKESDRKERELAQMQRELSEVRQAAHSGQDSAGRQLQDMQRKLNGMQRENQNITNVMNNQNQVERELRRENQEINNNMTNHNYGGSGGGGGGGGPKGPPPREPVMLRQNPRSKNLDAAFKVKEENARRRRVYEKQMDAYHGVSRN